MLYEKRSTSFILVCAGLLTAIFFMACGDSDVSLPETSRQVFGYQSGSLTLPEVSYNQLNPYDSIGLIHNEALCYAFNRVYDTSVYAEPYTFMDTIITRLAEYYVSKGFFEASELPAKVSGAKALMLSDVYSELFSSDSYISTYSNDSLSSLEIYYIRRVGEVVENAELSVSAVLDSISAIENDILQIDWPAGQVAAYGIISITKYSFAFWSSFSDQSIQAGGPGLAPSYVKYMAEGDIRSYLREIVDIDGRHIGWERVFEFDVASATRPIVSTATAIWDAICWAAKQIAKIWS